MSVSICCEGPLCNHGISADVREHVSKREYPSIPLYDEAMKRARLESTRALAVTPHTENGTNGFGSYLFCCDLCGHERVYGNTESHYMFASPRR
jgi:hypothetical protein